ncbi:MAG TPA: DUF4129 domain-containing protein [Phytomonospora sp.]
MAQLRRWAPLLVVAALVMLIAGAAAVVDLKAADVDVPSIDEILGVSQSPTEVEETFRPTAPPVPDGAAGEGVHPFLWVVVGTVAVFLLGVIVFAVIMILRNFLENRRFRPTRPLDFAAAGAEQETSAEEVREVVQAGLADIDAGDDPRKAVIACWLRLEKAAATAGTARMVSDTPGDLVTRLLSAHRVNDRALQRLADSYRQARYAPDVVTEQVRADARQALVEIDAELAAAVREAAAVSEATP